MKVHPCCDPWVLYNSSCRRDIYLRWRRQAREEEPLQRLLKLGERNLSVTLYGRLNESSLRCAQGCQAETVLRSQAASNGGRKHQPCRGGQRDLERDEFMHS